MDTARAERQARIKAVACRLLGVEEDQVDETTLFKDELDATSMKLIELLAALEIEYDVEIDESALDRMVNLKGVYDVLDEALGAG